MCEPNTVYLCSSWWLNNMWKFIHIQLAPYSVIILVRVECWDRQASTFFLTPHFSPFLNTFHVLRCEYSAWLRSLWLLQPILQVVPLCRSLLKLFRSFLSQLNWVLLLKSSWRLLIATCRKFSQRRTLLLHVFILLVKSLFLCSYTNFSSSFHCRDVFREERCRPFFGRALDDAPGEEIKDRLGIIF